MAQGSRSVQPRAARLHPPAGPRRRPSEGRPREGEGPARIGVHAPRHTVRAEPVEAPAQGADLIAMRLAIRGQKDRRSGLRPGARTASGERLDHLLSLLGRGPAMTALRQPNRAGDGVLPTQCCPTASQIQDVKAAFQSAVRGSARRLTVASLPFRTTAASISRRREVTLNSHRPPSPS